MKYLAIFLVFVIVGVSIPAIITQSYYSMECSNGVFYVDAFLYGTDTLNVDIDLNECFGGTGQFNGMIWYKRCRSDKDTAHNAVTDSVNVSISYLYGSVYKRNSDQKFFAFSIDTIGIDTGNVGAKQQYDTTQAAVIGWKYRDLYSLAYQRGEYQQIITGYSRVIKTGGDSTVMTHIHMRPHTAARIRMIGRTGNANKRNDNVSPIDSSRGTRIFIQLHKVPNDVDGNNQRESEWMNTVKGDHR